MEFRIGKLQLTFKQADKYHRAAVTNQIHGVIHRMLITCRVDHFLRQRTANCARSCASKSSADGSSTGNSRRVATCSRRAGLVSATTTCAPSALAIAAAPRPDWPRPDHQHLLAGSNGCATHRMSANSERFNQCCRLRVNTVCGQNVRHRHAQILTKTAILMHAND